MILSYNISNSVKKSLSQFNALRTEILLTPLPPEFERTLRWDATINRTYCWLSQADISTSRAQIESALTQVQKSRVARGMQHIRNYGLAVSHIHHNWLGNTDPVSVAQVQVVADYIGYTIENPKDAAHTLNYLQATSGTNPLILSAIMHLHFTSTPIAHLTPLIFLYKYGYDLRGLLIPELAWLDTQEEYIKAVKNTSQAASLTLWLEFYIEASVRSAKRVKRLITYSKDNKLPTASHHLDLNERQKSIIALFNEPGMSLTNRKVQARFRISQLTASRDLSKLTSIGLLLSHGKGRSVYYTKV